MTTTLRILNTVKHPQYPCPTCGQRRPMHVFEDFVAWGCGHTRSLPPITPTGIRSRWQTEKATL